MRIWIMMIVTFALSCSFAQYSELELIVPNDFSGPFVVVVDPQGEEVPRGSQNARFHIPRCRVLRIRSDHPFREMRIWKVRRENGEQILKEYELEDFSGDGKIALRGGAWGSTTRNGKPYGERGKYFIGTAKEFESFDFLTFLTPSCDE